MAKQEESGNYRSVDGRAYTDEHEARNVCLWNMDIR